MFTFLLVIYLVIFPGQLMWYCIFLLENNELNNERYRDGIKRKETR